MLRRALILLLMVLVGEVQAQCGAASGNAETGTNQEDRHPSDEIVPVVNATQRMTTNIAFIVDASGSMNNSGRIEMAIAFAQSILGQECDEMVVALFAFKASHTRWPGVPHDGDGPPPPEGWTEFPGVGRLESAQEWLTAQGATGDTNPVSAIDEALSQDVKDMTVILITDGEDFDIPAFLQAVRSGQTSREARGVGRAVIVIIGIGPNSAYHEHLLIAGGEGGGGMYVIRPPGVPPEGD